MKIRMFTWKLTYNCQKKGGAGAPSFTALWQKPKSATSPAPGLFKKKAWAQLTLYNLGPRQGTTIQCSHAHAKRGRLCMSSPGCLSQFVENWGSGPTAKRYIYPYVSILFLADTANIDVFSEKYLLSMHFSLISWDVKLFRSWCCKGICNVVVINAKNSFMTN